MRRNRGRLVLRYLAMLLLLAAAPARADDQLWLQGVAQGPINGKLITWLEVQPRFSLDPLRTTQFFVRPAIGVQVNPGTSLLFGYMYAESYPEGRPAVQEHRIWQQALIRLAGTPKKAVLMSRTRLEERFVVGNDDSALRLRQFLRGQVWVGDDGWSLIAVSEAFFGFESTSWGQNAGFEQMRNFFGVGVPLSKRVTLEAGYLNQWLIRPGQDRDNNVISVSLFYRLG
jgi:hypothetical protein